MFMAVSFFCSSCLYVVVPVLFVEHYTWCEPCV